MVLNTFCASLGFETDTFGVESNHFGQLDHTILNDFSPMITQINILMTKMLITDDPLLLMHSQ